MDKEYIDREAFIEEALKKSPMCGSVIAYYADHFPASDVEEVKHGRWIRISANMIYCSCCEDAPLDKAYNWWPVETPYCPLCGAKMDSENNG